MIRHVFVVLATLTLVAFLHLSAEAAKPKHRRYSQGPLKLTEFRRDAREALPFRAMTMTRVMYDYKFDVKQTSSTRFEATLTSLNAFSVFLPNESWWHDRARQSLLDHEQGHFDIAEISARRLQLAFRQALAEKKPIRGAGKSMAAARGELEKKLKQVFDFANEQAVEENRQYDLQTRHGNRYGSQDEFRRIQLLTLNKLGEQLAGKQTKVKPRPKNEPTAKTKQD